MSFVATTFFSWLIKSVLSYTSRWTWTKALPYWKRFSEKRMGFEDPKDVLAAVAANQVERVLGELITATCEQLAHSDPSHADRLLGKWSSRLRPASQLIGRLGLDEDDLTDVDIALVNELLNEDAQTLVEIAEAIPGTLSERVSRARTIAGQLPQATSAPDQWRRLPAIPPARAWPLRGSPVAGRSRPTAPPSAIHRHRRPGAG